MSYGLLAAITYLAALGGLREVGYLSLSDLVTQVIVVVQSGLFFTGIWGYLMSIQAGRQDMGQLAHARAWLASGQQAHARLREMLSASPPTGLLRELIEWALLAVKVPGFSMPAIGGMRSGGDLRPLAQLLVTLGLLGTFLGFVQVVGAMRSPSADLISVLGQILGGMDQALGTSIVGLVGYAMLSGLTLTLNHRQRPLSHGIEELSRRILLLVAREPSPVEVLCEELRQLPATLSDAVEASVHTPLRQALEEGAQRVGQMVSRLEAGVQRLEERANLKPERGDGSHGGDQCRAQSPPSCA